LPYLLLFAPEPRLGELPPRIEFVIVFTLELTLKKSGRLVPPLLVVVEMLPCYCCCDDCPDVAVLTLNKAALRC